jgi:hypothetical protein
MSTMPPRAQLLTRYQLRDLIAYLASLKTPEKGAKPKPKPKTTK